MKKPILNQVNCRSSFRVNFFEDQLNEIKEDNTQKDSRIKELEQELTSLNDDCETALEKAKLLAAENAQLISQESQKSLSENEQLQEILDAKEVELKSLAEELDQLKKKNKILKLTNENLNASKGSFFFTEFVVR